MLLKIRIALLELYFKIKLGFFVDAGEMVRNAFVISGVGFFNVMKSSNAVRAAKVLKDP